MSKKEKTLIDEMVNMLLDKEKKRVLQILFNPTKEQEKNFWCDKCDGFHKTKDCPEINLCPTKKKQKN